MVIDGRYTSIGSLLKIKEGDQSMVRKRDDSKKGGRWVDEVTISNREASDFRLTDLESALELLERVKSDMLKSDISKIHKSGI